jgi:hypothetical protein
MDSIEEAAHSIVSRASGMWYDFLHSPLAVIAVVIVIAFIFLRLFRR